MFERLAGKVLSRLLSKYFNSNDSSSASNNSSSSWNNLGVWSGYVSLEKLVFKHEILNDYFKAKGIPLEIISFTIKRVEMTVPWAKLHDPNEVVVMVLDGVHILIRVHLCHYDEAVRNYTKRKRRQALIDSELFGKESGSYSDVFKKRVTEGILKDILDKLHIHIRNVHIRMEDEESQGSSPFAIGLTLESLHVHHDIDHQDGTNKAVVCKVAQLNHLAVYCNALENKRDIPPELAGLLHWSTKRMEQALDQTIARRASSLASPESHAPKHVYLLLPVDATAHIAFSTTPNNLEIRPALLITLDIDDVSIQLRDVQIANTKALLVSLQEHSLVKEHRPYRPRGSVIQNPKAWWTYAVRVISISRWSWNRFHQRYEQRKRYCELYERQKRFPAVVNGAIDHSSHTELNTNDEEGSDLALGAKAENENNDPLRRSNSTDSINRMPLTPTELNELVEFEDGIRGDLSVHDIVLFRALIKARLANIATSEEGGPVKQKSRLRRLMRSVITDDIESEEEYEHLLAYLEKANKAADSDYEDLTLRSLVAISLQANLGRGCITLLSPLASTADLNQHRRIHERFMDTTIVGLHVGYSLHGNFEAFRLQSSVDTLSIKEVRSDKKEYSVVSRLLGVEQDLKNYDEANRIIFVELLSDPPDNPEYDIGVHAQINAILISLSSSCEWIHRIGGLFKSTTPNTSKMSFWEGLRMLQGRSSMSKRAEFLTKIDAALNKHKNLDLNIQVKMPTVAIDDSHDRVFVIDLGEASITTERLAGVSTGKLNYSSIHQSQRKASLDENGNHSQDDRASTPADDEKSGSFLESPRLTPRLNGLSFRGSPSPRGLDTVFLGRSSNTLLSVDDKRIRSSSMSINEHLFVSTIDQTDDMTNESTVNTYQSSFYDVFNLQLSKPRLILRRNGEHEESDLLTQLEIKVVFEVSVIPTDHTLCRLIANCTIEDIGISCSATDIDNMLSIYCSWKAALSLSEWEPPSSLFVNGWDSKDVLKSCPKAKSLETSSDSSSVLDEAEFIDALDGGGSEGNNDWFDENFVVDTESTVASESQSMPLGTRRRRPRSMSDTSSISEISNVQPKLKIRRHDGAYLSAENLAKLEENGGEDHSDAESEDSFHSAVVSLQDRQELLDAIKHDIDRVTDQLWKLNRKLSECTASTDAVYESTTNESAKRRHLRKSINLDISRAEAELKALRASRQDLLNSLPASSDIAAQQEGIPLATPCRQQRKDRVIDRANSVLRSRRKRVTIMETDGFVHCLTNKLNREIFRGSFNIKRGSFQLSRLSSFTDQNVSLDTTITKVSVATIHKSNDTKVFASVDCLQVRTWFDSFAERIIVLTGGDDYTLSHAMLSTTFPQLISSSTNDEKFVRLAIHTKGNTSGGKLSKVRLLIGGVEVVPMVEVTSALLNLKSNISRPKVKDPSIDIDTSLEEFCQKMLGEGPEGMQTHGTDFIVRFSSIRCRFRQGGDTIGAFAASEVGVRVARSMKSISQSSRCQVDLRCTNIQVLEIKSTDSSNAVEILGRRDPYGHLLVARIRMQTVPSEHVGGWVVGGKEGDTSPIQNCVNCHVGFRCNPLQLIASRSAFEAMKDTLSFRDSSVNDVATPMRSNVTTNSYTVASKLNVPMRVRWRIDFAASNVAIVVPGKAYMRVTLPGMSDSNVLTGLSVQACAQRSSSIGSGLDMRLTAKDIHLTRTSDDWPILERTTLCLSFFLPNILRGDNVSPNQLVLPIDSMWLRDELVSLEFPFISTEEPRPQASILASPLRFNLSSRICSLLTSNLEGIRNQKRKGSSDGYIKTKSLHIEFDGRIILDLVEIRLFRQSQNSTSIALADRMASALLTKCSFSMIVRHQEIMAHFDVSEAAVCDLSSLPGVRILGSSPLGVEGRIVFLRLSIGVSNLTACPRALQVNLNWGDVQIIPIPSFIKSLIQFKTELDEFLGPKLAFESKTNNNDIATLLSQDIFVVFSFEIQIFECVLSSRSILAYLRDKSKDPINVVSFRWASSTKGFLLLKHALSEVAATMPSSSLVVVDDLFMKASHDFETLCDFEQRCLQRFTNPFTMSDTSNDPNSLPAWQAFTIRINLAVTDFQALRTTIQQDQDAFKKDRGTPHKFTVQPPIYGEQRITNQINFRTRYRLSGTNVELPRIDVTSELRQLSQTSVAQAVHFDAGFVDVLVYIRQSAGGLNDAYRETIQPIQALLRSSRYDGNNTTHEKREPALVSLLRRATTVFSAKLDGFQVTCVPGGATRLTESPIIKAALSNLHLNLVLLFVPRLLGDMATKTVSSSFNLADDLIGHTGSFTASGWVSGELSAHYHNRRLVAWEPVVEPWTVHGQFGADLNRLFGQPVAKSIWQIENKALTSTERLRDIGWRWVSKFASDAKQKTVNDIDANVAGNLMSDLPYILLTSLGWDIISKALHVSVSNSSGIQVSSKLMLPPGSNPRVWLELFGLPSPPDNDNTSPILCSVSDTKPLNINITGGLIENLSTYLGLAGLERVRSAVPHWIRNETGLTIRFQEVLALDRQRIGERATKTILASGREIPLSLKRTLSQSCDPHRATIRVELGKYDESHSRVTGIIADNTEDTHPNSYCYRTTIAVDTVGVKKIPLLPNENVMLTGNAAVHCSKLYIIARVSLNGDNKVVSLESPILVKNTSEIDLAFKIAGSTLLWSSSLAAASRPKGIEQTGSLVPVPADIIPLLDIRAVCLTVSSFAEKGAPSLVAIPPAYSEKSLSKGKICEEEITLSQPSNKMGPPASLNICGLRIGSVDMNSDFASDVKTQSPKLESDPQQRMILVRPSVVIHNQLPVSLVIWVRPKRVNQLLPKTMSTNLLAAFSKREKLHFEIDGDNDDNGMWLNMGRVDSGGSVSWSGASSDETVELKVLFVENDGEQYRNFPCVSSKATIIATPELVTMGSSISTTKLQMTDAFNTLLSLTTTVETSSNLDIDASSARELVSFASKLTSSPREVSISVPYWIVDSSGLELEYALNASFVSSNVVAGQFGPLDSRRGATHACPTSLGLAEFLDMEGVMNSLPASAFVILMIGDKAKPNLKIRRRARRFVEENNGDERPWSRSIQLRNAYSDINLPTLNLRSQTLSAPSRFGGKHGTKIIHILSKIQIINELGRDIELAMCRGKEWPTLVTGGGQPTPFHCFNEGKIKFRPTEFGWKWSGSLELREERKDVTLRLVHKLRGQVILVTVDFFIGSKSVGDRVIFRDASHPPFRIENHTMHALRYFQGYSADISIASQESTLLAFQSVDYAWDEPDADMTRSDQDEVSLLFTLEVVDLQFSADESEGSSRLLGRLELESVAPGTDIIFSRFSHLSGKVVADGPTKVLHIIDTSLPRLDGDDGVSVAEIELGVTLHLDKTTAAPCWINVKMTHGIGISVVDWTPQELIYIRFDDIMFDRSITFTHESVSFSVGRISIDNQLWVTPYPVLLHIDKRTGRRTHHALSLSARRALKDQGGLSMVDKLEISIEPISLQVDGYLVELLQMAYRLASQTILKVELSDAYPILPFEEAIGSLLTLCGPPRKVTVSNPYASVLSENFVESGAWATKSAGKIRLGSSMHYRAMDVPEGKPSRRRMTPKTRRRAYINRTVVSALKAEISWAGPLPLPMNLSGLRRYVLSSLRSVLTFEAVPVSVGAFSSEHTYSDDIADSSKHHYKSYLRPGAVLGMLAALPFRAPVSVLKAIVYTSNQFCAEFLDSLAAWNKQMALGCLRLTPRELLPSYASKQPTECIVGASWPYMITMGRLSLGTSKFFHFWTTVFSAWASNHRYAGIRNAGDQLAVRRRNPRLFAHINGQDLLVEYVEGVSAGKALLSRVRQGRHLGEGYVYHTENVMLSKEISNLSEKSIPDDSRSLILMVSFERILVLNGNRGFNFCEVLWEVTFSNLVHIEVQECKGQTFDVLMIWYLTDTTHSAGNRDDLFARMVTIMTTDIGVGLAVLCCKTLFIPRESQLRSKLAALTTIS